MISSIQKNYKTTYSDFLPNPPKIKTLKDLYVNAIADLGDMSKHTYHWFLERAYQTGISKPIMFLNFEAAEDVHIVSLPILITIDNWDFYQKFVIKCCTLIPRVFVINGSKFSV